MNTLLKIHEKIKRNIIAVSVALILIPIILVLIIPHEKYSLWKFQNSVCTIPFTTDENGYIYIQASFADTSGLFFVDTGSDLTCIKETLIDTKDTLYFKKLFDAQGISKRKKMIRIANFKIGEIEFPTFKIWPTDIESWNRKGFMHKNDSVIGVIGSDILLNFTCEFNMEKREISIYKPNEYPSNLPDSLSIPLNKKGTGYFTEIEIDSVKYPAKFDTGCSTPLVLKDTFSVSGKDFRLIRTNKNGNHKTFFSHLKKDTISIEQSVSSILPKVILGTDTFQSVICNEKAKTNLLGVPFFWSFEKVIADYPNQKSYFLNRTENLTEFDITSHTSNTIRNAFLQKRGTCTVKTKSFLKYNIQLITTKKTGGNIEIPDTIPAYYKIYGESKWWGKNLNTLDNILCMDSVLLPNNNVIYGEYKIDVKKKYFYDD